MNGVDRKNTSLVAAGVAAFATYFCMYAYRKPFTAGLYEGQQWFGLQLKAALILSQLLGYTLSKFIGIRFVSGLRPELRGQAIVLLIAIAQLALIVFAIGPPWLKIVAIFFNGLPLGMVFGLVVSYLEGRRETEALSALLCASFIISSGVVKTVGRWLVESVGISEFWMPATVGVLFALPTFGSVLWLSRTPAPSVRDEAMRSQRRPMRRSERVQFWQTWWPGLVLLVFIYMALTIVRTLRDDFGVEIWRDLGVAEKPRVFAISEICVGIITTGLAALPVLIQNNFRALTCTGLAMVGAFVGATLVGVLQSSGLPPLVFMVVSGVCLYIPYVAFHTTVFERLVALSPVPANLAFLMYFADAFGYLGYSAIIVWKTSFVANAADAIPMLPVFRWGLIASGIICTGAMLLSFVWFRWRLASLASLDAEDPEPVRRLELHK